MATIIDSLVISLGLDTSGFNKGQKEATESLRKLEGDASKHVKGVQSGFDGLLSTFKEFQGRLLAIGAIVATGLGFNRLIQDATRLNSEIGYLAKSLGVSAKELSAWENVGATVGATANDIASSFASIQKNMAQMQISGQSPLNAFAYATHMKGQGPAVELYDKEGKWKSPTDILMGISKWAEAQQNKAVASQMISQLGMGQGMTNLLLLGPKELEKRLKQNEQFAPTEEQIKKFQALQEAFGNLLNVTTQLTNIIASKFAPLLTKILNIITDVMTKLTGGANPADVAAESLAKGGMTELEPKAGKPGIFAGTLNWLSGKGWNGDKGAAGSGTFQDRWNGLGGGATQGSGGSSSGTPGGGTRGDRNNNPGNMKFGPLAQAFGATHADDRGFAVFPNFASGDAAQEALVKSNAYRGLTLDQFGNKYSEGNADWKKTVGGALGIGNNDIVNVDDPRLLSAIRKAEGTAQGGRSGTSGGTLPGGSVPEGVLSKAEDLLRNGASTGELQQFMASQGYPKNGAWCGEFAASVVKSAGGTPPAGAAVASNWLKWGSKVEPGDARPGDIAVRKYSRYGGEAVPGQTGSHVGIYKGAGEDGETFSLLAGNQSRAVNSAARLSQYEFRRGFGAKTALEAGGGSSTTNNTNSSATHINEMNVSVPAGADPAGYARGIQQELQRFDNVQNSMQGLQ